jgi:adenosylmethionine-8-amino-7-oxononanoate aminotransferase
VLVRGIRGVALQISPPFVITEDELATMSSVLGEALDAAA